jgi:hypothetical protein
MATLTVAKAGTAGGSGTVTSNPPGISCGGTCSAPFTVGTPVLLTATAGPDTFFMGWSGGGCPASPTSCNIVLTANTNVTAIFELGGTIEIRNEAAFTMENMTITNAVSGPFGFAFSPPILVQFGEPALLFPARPGSYTIPGGQYYSGFSTAACPAAPPFSVAPGGTTVVTYSQMDNSPLLDCQVTTGAPLRRRR